MYRICLFVLATMIADIFAQRSPYAGLSPIGFPQIETTSTGLENRFGSNNASGTQTTTQKLPIEALGDRNLINRISKLPKDNQPFWYLNWQALEEHRRNPQTFDHKPNNFLDPFSSSSTSQQNIPNRTIQNRVQNVLVNQNNTVS